MGEEKEKKPDYIYVPIPKELVDEADQMVGSHGYRSRAELVKDAVRTLLRHYQRYNEQKLEDEEPL